VGDEFAGSATEFVLPGIGLVALLKVLLGTGGNVNEDVSVGEARLLRKDGEDDGIMNDEDAGIRVDEKNALGSSEPSAVETVGCDGMMTGVVTEVMEGSDRNGEGVVRVVVGAMGSVILKILCVLCGCKKDSSLSL